MFKVKTPNIRPDNNTSQTIDGMWWLDDENLPKADSAWILDPEIPENYIPVPGEDELYMVIDENGNITKYRHRELNEDGVWMWETVNPDIPDNYEAVEGLKNIYKVTNSDGTITYFKYIRNEDDTFAFVPVDENGNYLEDKTPTGSEIPENYKRITGNIYAVYDKNNVIIGYKERSVDEDGNYIWTDCDKPDVPEKNDSSNTETSNNNDNTSTKENASSVEQSRGETSIDNSTSKDDNSQNNYSEWVPEMSIPDIPSFSIPEVSWGDTSLPEFNQSQPEVSVPNGNNDNNSSESKTRTETETIITYETTGGWKITYQTVIIRVYDADGELLSTKKEGPIEISRAPASESDNTVIDKSNIKDTLPEEFARVSVGLLYDKGLAGDVLALINAERAAGGIGTLSMQSNSTAQLMSQIRAADMAVYNHSDYDSAMYGTLQEMMEKYNVASGNSSEIVWKTSSDKSASAIASRIKILAGESINDPTFTSIGISIVSKGGYYYVNVILI